MEEWKEYKAKEFCSAVTDGTHDSPKPKTGGHYLITSKHLKNNRIDFSSANQISEEDYQKVILRSAVEQYDILFSMIGTIGNTVQVKQSHVDFAVKNMGIFKMGKNPLKSTWLYYWLNSNFSKEYINQRLSGSTQSYLTLDSLRSFPVLYPGDANAQAIVSILKSLDDKIEVNRRINENLEQQAQALFKSWFVDFEPFKDGEFVESELGMIPKGWRVLSFNDICSNITDGVHNTVKDEPRGDCYLLSCKNIKGGTVSIGENERKIDRLTFEKLRKRTKLQKGDILLSSVGTIGEMVFLNEEPDNYEFQRSVAIIKPNNEMIEPVFLFYSMQNQKETIVRSAHGAVQQCLFISDISNFTTILPPYDVMKRFADITIEFQNTITNNEQESRRLATLRGTLLPKLMSGELRVSDTDLINEMLEKGIR